MATDPKDHARAIRYRQLALREPEEAAEAALIRDLATDKTKRGLYGRLHQHFYQLADEVEQAIK